MHEGADDLTVFHHSIVLPAGTVPGIDEAFCYLTTTGRKTGRPHEIEIWFGSEAGQTLYLLSGGGERSDWVRNLKAEPRVQVRVGASHRAGTAHVVEPGTDEDALARRLLLAKYADPDKDDLSSWGRSALAVALDLDG